MLSKPTTPGCVNTPQLLFRNNKRRMSRNLGSSVLLMYQYLRFLSWDIGVIVRGLAHGARIAHAVIVGGKLSFQRKIIFVTFSLLRLLLLWWDSKYDVHTEGGGVKKFP